MERKGSNSLSEGVDRGWRPNKRADQGGCRAWETVMGTAVMGLGREAMRGVRKKKA